MRPQQIDEPNPANPLLQRSDRLQRARAFAPPRQQEPSCLLRRISLILHSHFFIIKISLHYKDLHSLHNCGQTRGTDQRDGFSGVLVRYVLLRHATLCTTACRTTHPLCARSEARHRSGTPHRTSDSLRVASGPLYQPCLLRFSDARSSAHLQS